MILVHNFFTAIIYIYIYIHIIQFHLYHSSNIYSNWLQEPFCNLSLYALHIYILFNKSLKKEKDTDCQYSV
jgi:hypothetical protein